MDDTDVSAAQHGVLRTARLMGASVAAMLFVACTQGPTTGISVICESNGKNKISKPKPGLCPQAGGPDEEECYDLVPIDPIFKCYGKDDWLTMDIGEMGEVEETEGIDPSSWPIHEPSLAYIRKYCTEKCTEIGAQNGQQYTCDEINWIIFGYDGVNKVFSKVLATALEDPGALNCNPELGRWKRSPAGSKVVQGDSALWPSDSVIIDLACATVQSCAALFDENIMGHLAQSSFTPPGNDEADADYLATAGIGSSTLMLRIANSDNPSQGSNPVAGRIEYTALDCGQPTCPLYLGNLTVTNTSHSWDLHTEALNADVEVTNLHVRLRGPTLGVWRPATGEIYFDEQMLDLRVDFDLAVAGEPASTVTKYVTNDAGLFGVRRGNNAIEWMNLSMREGDLEAYATLHYDSVDGSPPVASFSLPSTVVLGQSDAGLLVSSIPENSTDPDGDLVWKQWLIDDQQVGSGYVILPGLHTIRREVRDSRSAFDAQEQLVLITYEDQE